MSQRLDAWQQRLKGTLVSPFAVKMATLLLAVMLAWQLGTVSQWLWVSPQTPPLPKIHLSQGEAQSVQGQRIMLFGQPSQSIKPVAQPVVTAKKTTLNLKLIGVIDLGDRGVALIEKRGKTLVVSPGEQIQPGVKLLRVLSQQVIIDHNGQQERLILQGADEVPSSKPSNGQTSSFNQNKLNRIVSQLRRSPLSISQYLRFQPLRRNNQWVGVQIWPKSEVQIFRALGFRPGDIIRQIDGMTIQQMSEKPQLWNEFTHKSQFELLIDRHGNLMTLPVDLNHPNGGA